jgi:tRNA threonylcarbamoyladenosine modification (KEOPS) complex  Pcc1 subunit
MKAKTTVRLRFSSEKQLSALLNALAPETNRPATSRARAVLNGEGNFLVLKVEAKDTVALRAALNAYLRWISSAVKVLQVIDRCRA